MDKRYDQAALLHAYIASRDPYGHADIMRFNVERLAAVEQAFGLRLTAEDVTHHENRNLWMESTKKSGAAASSAGGFRLIICAIILPLNWLVCESSVNNLLGCGVRP